MLTVKEGGGGAGLALVAAWALAGVAVPVAAHAGEAVVVEVGPGRAARVARHAAQQRVGVQHEAPLALGALVRLWAGAADARLVALCTSRREGTSTAFVMEALTATPRCCQFVTISTRVQWNHAAVFTGGEKLVHLKYAGLRINQSINQPQPTSSLLHVFCCVQVQTGSLPLTTIQGKQINKFRCFFVFSCQQSTQILFNVNSQHHTGCNS